MANARTNRRLKISLWLLAAAVFLSPLPTQAAMRCSQSLIDRGASTYEVLRKCGEPVFQETIREPLPQVRLGYSTQAGDDSQGRYFQEVETPLYREIERWTYDLGTGTLLRQVDFYQGKVIRVEATERAD